MTATVTPAGTTELLAGADQPHHTDPTRHQRTPLGLGVQA